MTGARRVEPLEHRFDGEVWIPGSKSLTNRALLCAGLATGTSELTGVLFADDTEAMVENLRTLGARIDEDRDARHLSVTGNSGELPTGRVELWAHASGTTARFLLPSVASGTGTYVLHGDPSLSARPMADGLELVESVGVRVTSSDGHLPIQVTGPVASDIPVRVRGDVSSQFLSGVLLAAPTWPNGREIVVDGALVSRPYVDMTIAVMRAFGAQVDDDGPTSWHVHGTGYTATHFAIEPDASAASYLFAAAALTGSRVRVPGLGRDSLQGDLQFVRVLERMGARVSVDDHATTVEGVGELHGVVADLRDFSDTAETLAVTAAFADSPTHISGIGFIRKKETDRIGAVVRELDRLGVRAEEEPDGLVVYPGPVGPGTVATYDDHRMAMSFALAGLRVPGIEIADPDCVAKTFPDYFAVLDTLRARSDGPGGPERLA